MEVVQVPLEAKTVKLVKKKRRPARVQIDREDLKEVSTLTPTGLIYNVWYNKYSGGDRLDQSLSQTAAKRRCVIARDSGWTQADKINGSQYFCLPFARGLCYKGSDCEYFHRSPKITDIFNPNIDCFGRDKHSDYRDDMGGVGSFMRQNRTLYVGRIHTTDDIEEVVARHFHEWGQVERTRVLTARGVAFVTYTNEANAQFAKEAMAHQSLDHNEVLNVRWATADPNPQAQKREIRRIEEQAADAIRAALPSTFLADIEGRDPDATKRRKIEGSFGLQGYEAPDDIWYANEAATQTSLEATGKNSGLLLAPEDDPAVEDKQASDQVEEKASGGILSTSTLAALNGSENGMRFTAAKVPKPVGPLVAYSSDDDGD